MKSLFSKVSGATRILVRQVYDIQALGQLQPLYRRYLPWTRSSMRPSAIRLIASWITIYRPSLIVEFGGGNSTYILANLLQAQGHGRLISFDHNGEWVEILQSTLNQEGLRDVVSVVHAPLKPITNVSLTGSWYDSQIVEQALEGKEKVNGMIVDGPPGKILQDSNVSCRYFALPIIKPFLDEEFAIFADDWQRQGESEMCHLWGKELALPIHTRGVSGGIAYILSNHRMIID